MPEPLVPPSAAALRSVPLTTGAGAVWSVRATDGPVPAGLAYLRDAGLPATVPGLVHTDLMAAGAVPDPFDGDNERELAWVGRTSWRFSGSFAWAPDGRRRQDLVLRGLDTVAVVTLNGTELGRTANQHRTYRFDVTDVLVAGTNELVVDLAAPVDAAERLAEEAGPRPHVNHHPFNAVRKAASNFGWDWGIDVATVGVWREVGLESWSDARLAAVRPLAGVDGTDGVLDTHVDLVREDPAGAVPAAVEVDVAGRTARTVVAAGETSTLVTVRVPDVDLWWPRGHGEQPLHDVTVRLLTPAGDELGSWSGRVGFRTVTLDTAPDEHGDPFVLAVNGEPVHVRGANWVPDDALVTRLTPQTYRRGVDDAVDAGMNLLRVWGGGTYESEDLYRVCDELGVLVWQDFLFACAAYAEEEPLRAEVEAEAREAVTRLSQHASLVLWNGGNETFWGHEDWGWRPALEGRSWGEGYYTQLLPAVVAELDPRTPYTPGSPFSYREGLHPNDPSSGTTHVWDVWNEVDYAAYRGYRPRFVAEFGFQGPPAWSTLTSVVHDEPLDPYGPQMLVHQKADEGNAKLERGLGDHLPRWDDVDGWHWATQLNQARALALGIEHFRSLHPLTAGTVVWQLNDSWPVVSWAAVDSHGIRKPLWHSLRRVYADVLVTVQPRDGGLAVVVHNDAAQDWCARLQVVRRGTGTGTPELARQVVPLRVPARGAVTTVVVDEVATPGEPTAELLHVVAEQQEGGTAAPAFWYFVEDTALQVVAHEDALQLSVRRTDAGHDVTVRASALVKDVSLFPDRLDPAARVGSGLVTLVAGERHVFAVTSGELDEGALAAHPVLRSANDLLRPPSAARSADVVGHPRAADGGDQQER